MVDSLYDAVENADIMILGVNHDEYKNLDFSKIGSYMKEKHIYDTRNFFDEDLLIKLGYKITLLGRD